MSKAITLKEITKSYGDKKIYQNFNFEFKPSKIYALIGASGSGKTTLLNMISSLTSYQGQIEISGDISYIFQNERLIKTLTVGGNIDYVLKKKIPNNIERKNLIQKMLGEVELLQEINKYPHQLSGGMRQRVSLCRAFSYPSDILLMDEPYKSLDIALKYKILRQLINLWQNDKRTVIFVTHDIDEALLTADTICLLKGSPADFVFVKDIDTDKTTRDITDDNLSSIKRDIMNLI